MASHRRRQRRRASATPLFCTTLPLLKLLLLALPSCAFVDLQKHYQLAITSLHSSLMHTLCSLLATTATAPTSTTSTPNSTTEFIDNL